MKLKVDSNHVGKGLDGKEENLFNNNLQFTVVAIISNCGWHATLLDIKRSSCRMKRR